MKRAAITVSFLLIMGSQSYAQENPEETFIFYGENASRCNTIIEIQGARGFLSDSCKMISQNIAEIMDIMEWAEANAKQIENRDQFVNAAKEIGETIKRARFYQGRLENEER